MPGLAAAPTDTAFLDSAIVAIEHQRLHATCHTPQTHVDQHWQSIRGSHHFHALPESPATGHRDRTSAGPQSSSRCGAAPPRRLERRAERQVGLTRKLTLPADSPPLRLLLVMDNLAGHKTRPFVDRLIAHGVLPLYTPLGGSWLNMTESGQRIIVQRALDGQAPRSPSDIMDWLDRVRVKPDLSSLARTRADATKHR